MPPGLPTHSRVRIQGRYFELTDRFIPGRGRRSSVRSGGARNSISTPATGGAPDPDGGGASGPDGFSHGASSHQASGHRSSSRAVSGPAPGESPASSALERAARGAPRLVISEEPRLVISVPKRVVRLAVRRNTVKRVARESWRHATAADRARLRPPAILVRLVRSPSAPMPAQANTPVSEAATGGAPAPRRRRVVAPVAPALPLATFKRLLRADLDAILAGRVRPSGRRGPARAAAAPAAPSSS